MGYTVALVARLSQLSVRRISRLALPRIPRLPEPPGGDAGVVDGPGPPLHVALLGESSAAGIGAATADEALIGQLTKSAARRTGREVSWRLAARSGAVTAAVRRDLVPQLTDPAAGWVPDVVVVVVGVNDLIRFTRMGTWRREIAQLIAAIRDQVGDRPVLIAGLPPVQRVPALPRWLRILAVRRAAPMGRGPRRRERELRRASGGERLPPCVR